MKNRKYLISIIFLIGLLFLWQITLILIAIQDNFIGINFNSFNVNNTNSTIPRIIHQMWKTNHLLTYPIENSHSEWKKFYPNYEIRLWTDEDLEILINTEEYKYLKSIYLSYPYSIQRADLSRLIILHSEGGIYADLDVFPCSNKIEYLLLSNVSLIIPRSYTGSALINHFLIAQKSSTIIDYILHEMIPIKFYRRIYISPYLEVFSTGSLFLTRIINKYIQLLNNNKNDLWILSEDEVKTYVDHHMGRSWHSIDGFIFNLIDENPKLVLFLFIVFIIYFYFIFKYRISIYKFIQLKFKKKSFNEN
jgi:mannosyltransferase OCH1-like enzyme